jgi:hypothetical protein
LKEQFSRHYRSVRPFRIANVKTKAYIVECGEGTHQTKTLENEADLLSAEYRLLLSIECVHHDAVDKHSPIVG